MFLHHSYVPYTAAYITKTTFTQVVWIFFIYYMRKRMFPKVPFIGTGQLVLLRKSLHDPISGGVISILSSQIFRFFSLTLRSLSQLELIHVQREQEGSSITLLHTDIQFLHHLLKMLYCLQRMFWHLCPHQVAGGSWTCEGPQFCLLVNMFVS